MDVLVKFLFCIDQAQIGYHVELVEPILFKKLVLSFEHLLNVLVVEKDLGGWH